MKSNSSANEIKPFMSPLTVLAFAVGTSVDNEQFRSIAINMAHYHHERFDGSGTQFDSQLLAYFEKARPKIEAYYSALKQ